jgi:hypothetical protein
MAKVFISYRRGDTQSFVRRLHKELSSVFPDEGVFLDEGGIDAGNDYVEVLRKEIKNAYVFLPVIGKKWLKAHGDDGKPRIHEKDDVLRHEIALALKEEITIIPILFQNARMPTESDLPLEIRELARFQGVHIGHSSFDDDIQDILNSVDDVLQMKTAEHKKEEEEIDALTKELFGSDQDEGWEPPDLVFVQGVRLSDFAPSGEWEMEVVSPFSPDAVLGPNGRVKARFSLVENSITEGFWETEGVARGSLEGYIGYQLDDTDKGDPVLLGIVIEGVFNRHERFRFMIHIDEAIDKGFYGKDEAGRTYSLIKIGRAQL